MDNRWRRTLRPDSRSKVAKNIRDVLARHFPDVDEEGLAQLELIATRFENKVFESATSQRDYLLRISMKMTSIEASRTRADAPGSAFNVPPYDEY